MTSDGAGLPPEYAPFAAVSPPAVACGWKISGYPLFGGLTREDFRKSFDKMVGLVGRLDRSGVPIVAGTDGYGLEFVRELAFYRIAGTATIAPARMTGMATTTGAIATGMTAEIVLAHGDVSKDLVRFVTCGRFSRTAIVSMLRHCGREAA
jgi:imidazolonepropionase-like amidohydrolase